MSENREVNVHFNDHDGLPPEVLQILGGLDLQPLEINRDELFFQAGLAAGARGCTSHYLWPSIAAALLLVSIGLSVALVRQTNSSNSLQAALAQTEQAATLGATAGVPHSGSTVDEDRGPADGRLRQWQWLASSAPLPPGRLTVAGWEEMPRDSRSGELKTGSGESEGKRSVNPDSPFHRPATYLELMRQQREG